MEFFDEMKFSVDSRNVMPSDEIQRFAIQQPIVKCLFW